MLKKGSEKEACNYWWAGVKDGVSWWNGMGHDLRNGIIYVEYDPPPSSIIYAEYDQPPSLFLQDGGLKSKSFRKLVKGTL